MSCWSRTTPATPSSSASCSPRSTRTRARPSPGPSTRSCARPAGALRLRAARPQPPRQRGPRRAARAARADRGAAVCVLTGLDDEHLGTDAVAAGAQDYLVKGKVDGALLIRAIRYAVERRRAETSLLRLREEQLVAAESAAWNAGCCPRRCWRAARCRARTFYRVGRTRAVLGGDFFDAVRGPSGTVHAIVGDVSGHGPDEAALGALLRVSWRALVLAGVDEERLLPKLQRVLVSERHDSRLFTTARMITIVRRTRSAARALVRLAGHPPPVALGSRPLAHPAGRAAAGHRRERAGPPPIALDPAGRCCSTPTASSRAAAPTRRTALDRRTDGLLAADRDTATGPAARPARRARGGSTADRCSTTSRSCCCRPTPHRRTPLRPAWRSPRGARMTVTDRASTPPSTGAVPVVPGPPVLTPDRAAEQETPASPCAGSSPRARA